MSNARSTIRLIPIEPTDKELQIFGYAQGAYQITCVGCGQTKELCDKGSTSCRACACRRYIRVIGECGQPVPDINTDLGMAPKDVLGQLKRYCDSIEGKNELHCGILMANSAMHDAREIIGKFCAALGLPAEDAEK